jgi:hypothetical protein
MNIAWFAQEVTESGLVKLTAYKEGEHIVFALFYSPFPEYSTSIWAG